MVVHGTAGAMDKGDNPVHLRVSRKKVQALSFARDQPRYDRRAIYARQDTQIVARADLTARTTITFKTGEFFGYRSLEQHRFAGDCIIALETVERNIVLVRPTHRLKCPFARHR